MVARSTKRLLAGLLGLGVAAGASLARLPEAASTGGQAQEGVPADLEQGRLLYEEHCATCHGLDGQASGPDARRLFPKPRDLAAGVYKFRTTPSGALPADRDILRTITQGLPGTAMPAFEEFSPEQYQPLVSYVQGLSARFAEGPPPEPIRLAPDPGSEKADRARGRQLYQDLKCFTCHGNAGRGDGPSVRGPSTGLRAGLTDEQGDWTRATDLTQGWGYRGGSDPEAIALRILTGIDGTPMPSYAEAVSPEEAWQLAYHVRSLQEEPRWGSAVVAALVKGSLPSSPHDPAWATIPRTEAGLAASLADGLFPRTVKSVSVQAAYRREELVLRLAWDDPTQDRGEPADALGMVFQPEDLARPVESLSTWPLTGSIPLEMVFWSAKTDRILEGTSVGFSPVAEEQVPVARLKGQALYQDGRWSLTFRRRLPAGAPAVRIAIAVWDGGNADQGRQRSSSAWLDLGLQPVRRTQRP